MSGKRFIAAFAIAIAAAAGSAGVATTAQAQWYISGHVAGVMPNDTDASVSGSGTNGDSQIEYDYGYGLSGAIGYAWRRFRLEGEISYQQSDLDQVTVVTGGGLVFPATGALTGDTSATSYMVNGWYDFDTGSNWVPFIGGGVGAATVNLNVESVGGAPIGFDESDTVFAYQAGAGIGYKVTRKLTLGLSYRLFGALEPTFNNGVNQVDGEYLSHNFMAGAVVKF